MAKAPLFEGMGEHHHAITTDSPEAQHYFDQGLVLAFGFNHGEALRSFLHAAEIDPQAAMAWWGAAWVLGPNINSAVDPAVVPDAWEYLQRARAADTDATRREQAYIEALAPRYGPEALEDRPARDEAFAEARWKRCHLLREPGGDRLGEVHLTRPRPLPRVLRTHVGGS